jgi:predicted AlkP superfamily pyrophosphatase or phosphodiesterase
MPSKTFPNHYAIATGMYAGEHGIVANTFADSARAAVYSPADRSMVEDGSWYRGEPIWVSAQRQGLKTGTMFWVGSEADVQGVRPTYWHPFDDDMSDEARVDSVLAWLALPDRLRPRLLTLYFEFTDDAGSAYGPTSPEATAAAARADSMLGRLIRGANALPHGDRVDYVIVSDHGMMATQHAVFLSEHIDTTGVARILHGPFAVFYLRGDSVRIRSLKAQLAHVPHATVYERSELPAAWHWSDPRLGDLVLVAEPPWLIWPTARAVPAHGAHGWAPESSDDMRGIFVAAGPHVRAAGRIPAFRNVHVHPFLAALLGITPAAGISGDAAVLGGYVR